MHICLCSRRADKMVRPSAEIFLASFISSRNFYDFYCLGRSRQLCSLKWNWPGSCMLSPRPSRMAICFISLQNRETSSYQKRVFSTADSISFYASLTSFFEEYRSLFHKQDVWHFLLWCLARHTTAFLELESSWASPGGLLKPQTSHPHPDILTQLAWGGSDHLCFYQVPRLWGWCCVL